MPACGCPDITLLSGEIRKCTCQPCSGGNLNECSCNKETGCACDQSNSTCVCGASCTCANCPCEKMPLAQQPQPGTSCCGHKAE